MARLHAGLGAQEIAPAHPQHASHDDADSARNSAHATQPEPIARTNHNGHNGCRPATKGSGKADNDAACINHHTRADMGRGHDRSHGADAKDGLCEHGSPATLDRWRTVERQM